MRRARPLAELCGKTALADAGFTGEQNTASCAILCGVEGSLKDFHFACAPDQNR